MCDCIIKSVQKFYQWIVEYWNMKSDHQIKNIHDINIWIGVVDECDIRSE